MKVKFKKLHKDAQTPKRAHATDAGYDMCATERTLFPSQNLVSYNTGIAVAIPQGYAGFLFPRSSVSNTPLVMANCVGVIDSGYRGEISARYRIDNNCTRRFYEVGERVAQLVIMPVCDIDFEECTELDDTDRGTGGYGSTGR